MTLKILFSAVVRRGRRLRALALRYPIRSLILALVIIGAGAVSVPMSGVWPLESAVAACAHAEYKDVCYDQEIRATLKDRGLNAAFDVLAEIYNSDAQFAGGACHAETHVIGEEAYKQFHDLGATQLSDKAAYCGYGFYHGFMDQLVYETKDYDEARKFCAYAGEKLPNPPGYNEGACYHGIGHGVTDGTDPRLWGDALKMAGPGLALCQKVAGDNDDHLMRCASGVFNSLALQYRDPQYKLHTTNAFSVCEQAAYTGPLAEACYSQMNTLAMSLANYDFIKAMQATLSVPEGTNRTWAIKGVGETYFSTQRSLKKPVSASEVSRACGLFTTKGDADTCITSVVSGIQEYGTPGAEYKDMLPLCSSPDLDPKFIAECYKEAIFSTKWFYGQQKAHDMCANVPEQYHTSDCGQ